MKVEFVLFIGREVAEAVDVLEVIEFFFRFTATEWKYFLEGIQLITHPCFNPNIFEFYLILGVT